MFFQKLKYKIRTFNSKFTALHINWWNIFGRLILLLIIIGLSANIYSTFQKGYTTAERFQVEQEKLELIKKENDELKDVTLPCLIIPKGIYAKFSLSGKYGDVIKLIQWVYHYWLIDSGYETTTNPSYTIYHKNHFLSDDEEFVLDYYLPIKYV